MKRYFCDRCGKQVNIDTDGYVQMRVTRWNRGVVDRMYYMPDPIHSDGYEEYMMCAKCANEVFAHMEGMEDA